jgi:type IV pilus assembly protein PilM
LLDIGATTTDVNIIANGLFALTRNIPIAGDSFTQAIKSIAPGAGWAELERMKTEVDMAALLQGDNDSEAAALARTLQPAIDELLREVRRSTNYYQSQLADTANSILPAGTTSQTSGPVGKIVITGGSAKMRGLEAYMSARLGVPVEIWNPFQNPELEAGQIEPSFIDENHPFLVTAIGLALKELTVPAQTASTVPKFRNALAKAA